MTKARPAAATKVAVQLHYEPFTVTRVFRSTELAEVNPCGVRRTFEACCFRTLGAKRLFDALAKNSRHYMTVQKKRVASLRVFARGRSPNSTHLSRVRNPVSR